MGKEGGDRRGSQRAARGAQSTLAFALSEMGHSWRGPEQKDDSVEATATVQTEDGVGQGGIGGGVERQMGSGELLKVERTGFAAGFNEMRE